MARITENEIIEFLKKKNLKVTPQRLTICRIVLSSNNHPTAEQIYEIVKKEHKAISLATVYKNLAILDEIGMVRELHFNSNTSRYDPKMSVHINIVCSKCKSIIDYESEVLNKNWDKILGEIEGEIEGQRIDVYITCDKCKKLNLKS